jgi:hypothetical protein
MSYLIVKGINFKNNKVNVKGSSNNVTPKYYQFSEYEGLTRILEEQGKEAIIKEILQQYWDGNFQEGTPNNYSKAVRWANSKNLKYNWSNTGEGKEFSKEELQNDLFKYYNEYKKRRKGKFVIHRDTNKFNYAYLIRSTSKGNSYVRDIKNAKIHSSYEDAKINSTRIYNETFIKELT